jgi:outer membrane protein OmpA-like peptidoglycan-associated protein
MFAAQAAENLRLQNAATAFQGSREATAKLSRQRAEVVKGWLVEHGVDPTRLTTRGFGASRPLASNSTEDGRAQNRRVEIVRIGAEPPTGE